MGGERNKGEGAAAWPHQPVTDGDSTRPPAIIWMAATARGERERNKRREKKKGIEKEKKKKKKKKKRRKERGRGGDWTTGWGQGQQRPWRQVGVSDSGDGHHGRRQ